MPKKNEYTISLKQDGPAAKETRDSIAQQIEAYLQSGGQIDQIPSGVSGQISLGEKARQAREEHAQQVLQQEQAQEQAQQALQQESATADFVNDDKQAEPAPSAEANESIE